MAGMKPVGGPVYCDELHANWLGFVGGKAGTGIPLGAGGMFNTGCAASVASSSLKID